MTGFFWHSKICIVISICTCFFISVYSQKNLDCSSIENKRAKKHYEEALDNMRRKGAGDAITQLQKSLEIQDDYVKALFALGYTYYKNQNANQAIHYLERVKQICPEHSPYTFLYLGKIYFDNGRYGDAAGNLEAFLENPEDIKSDKEYNEADELLLIARFQHQIRMDSVSFNPQIVNNISTDADEYLPTMTPDNEIIYFTRRYEKKAKGDLVAKRIEEFTSSKFSEGEFGIGEKLSRPFNQNSNEGGATFSIDNKEMYFTICERNPNGYNNCDIYYSKFENNRWLPIESVKPVNLPNSWESQVSLSADGDVLYFASDREGGVGGMDIYKSVKDSSFSWSTPMNLGPEINTIKHEKSPFIHTDSKTLYFSSDGHMGLGGYDIFYSKLDSTGNYCIPTNIGYPINSEKDDLGFFVSTDGKTGYFASNELQGKGGWDVFSFGLHEKARPEDIFFIKGEIKDSIDSYTKVLFKNVATKQTYDVEVDSATGRFTKVLLRSNDYIMEVKTDKGAFNSRYLSKDDSTFEQPVDFNFEVKEIEIGKPYRINDINYTTNSSELIKGSKFVLDQFAEYLSVNTNYRIEIHGHTDNVGDEFSNKVLSTDRAFSVFSYLVEQGVDKRRLSFKGFGEYSPISSNESSEGRAKNRRTEFMILED